MIQTSTIHETEGGRGEEGGGRHQQGHGRRPAHQAGRIAKEAGPMVSHHHSLFPVCCMLLCTEGLTGMLDGMCWLSFRNGTR